MYKHFHSIEVLLIYRNTCGEDREAELRKYGNSLKSLGQMVSRNRISVCVVTLKCKE